MKLPDPYDEDREAIVKNIILLICVYWFLFYYMYSYMRKQL